MTPSPSTSSEVGALQRQNEQLKSAILEALELLDNALIPEGVLPPGVMDAVEDRLREVLLA